MLWVRAPKERVTEEYLRTQPLFQPRPGWRRGRAVLVRPRQDRGRPHQAGCGVQGHFLEAVLSWVRRLWVGLRRAGRSGVWTGRPPSSGVAGAGGSVRKGTGWYSWVGCPPGMVEGCCGWSVSFPVQQPFAPSPGPALRWLWEPASPPTSDSTASVRLCLFPTATEGGPSIKLLSCVEFWDSGGNLWEKMPAFLLNLNLRR